MLVGRPHPFRPLPLAGKGIRRVVGWKTTTEEFSTAAICCRGQSWCHRMLLTRWSLSPRLSTPPALAIKAGRACPAPVLGWEPMPYSCLGLAIVAVPFVAWAIETCGCPESLSQPTGGGGRGLCGEPISCEEQRLNLGPDIFPNGVPLGKGRLMGQSGETSSSVPV